MVCVVAGDDDTLIRALFSELDLAVFLLALLDALFAGLVCGCGIDGEVSERATWSVE